MLTIDSTGTQGKYRQITAPHFLYVSLQWNWRSFLQFLFAEIFGSSKLPSKTSKLSSVSLHDNLFYGATP